jgi:hypothetical protein
MSYGSILISWMFFLPSVEIHRRCWSDQLWPSDNW